MYFYLFLFLKVSFVEVGRFTWHLVELYLKAFTPLVSNGVLIIFDACNKTNFNIFFKIKIYGSTFPIPGEKKQWKLITLARTIWNNLSWHYVSFTKPALSARLILKYFWGIIHNFKNVAVNFWVSSFIGLQGNVK